MSYHYNFPAMAKLRDWRNDEQMTAIKLEMVEADEALDDLCCYRRRDAYAIDPYKLNWLRKCYGTELLDVIHACETALRIEFTDGEVSHMRDDVEDKNRERGYYGD